MKKYECLYIVNINYDSEGTSAVSARVEAVLKNIGAEVKNSQPWGKRKLAYAIDKERYGDFVLIHFEGENPDLAEFHRELEIEGAVMHYMTIRIDEFPDFDALTIPQAIDKDRKRPGAPGGRRPRTDGPPPAREAAEEPAKEEAKDVEASETTDSEKDTEEPADDTPAETADEETAEETAPAEASTEEVAEEAAPAEEETPAEEEAAEEKSEEEAPADEPADTEEQVDAEAPEAPAAEAEASDEEEKPADAE